jgi:competence ComEA-like helix-hairpin-helix protein
METISIVNPQRRVWLGKLLGLVLVMAICPGAAVFGAQDKSKKPPPPVKPFDINSASYEQIHSLPGIGPVTTQRILDFRKKSGPFQRVEDLMAVRGISAKRLEKIRQYIVVKPVTAAATPVKTPTPGKTAAPVKTSKDPGGTERPGGFVN